MVLQGSHWTWYRAHSHYRPKARHKLRHNVSITTGTKDLEGIKSHNAWLKWDFSWYLPVSLIKPTLWEISTKHPRFLLVNGPLLRNAKTKTYRLAYYNLRSPINGLSITLALNFMNQKQSKRLLEIQVRKPDSATEKFIFGARCWN